ncbi:DHH family phosphoesterase [Oscillospiraceae bacterium OttesenSCG-928-F05]|nr:DHH family phosphoesterase [Oscillospiraceae bacterium OttesenSCG-928-F05]
MSGKKRPARLFEPGLWMYFIGFSLFLIVLLWFQPLFSAAGFALLAVQYLVYRHMAKRRRKEILNYIDSLSVGIDSASKNSVLYSPFPMLVFRLDSGEVVWQNERFSAMVGEKKHIFEKPLHDLIPDMDIRWLMEGRGVCPAEVPVGDGIYQVFGNAVRQEGAHRSVLATLYFVECTDYVRLRSEVNARTPIVSIVMIDSYDEIMKNQTDSAKSQVLAEIDRTVTAWTSATEGLVRKYDRDKYLFVFEQRFLQDFVQKKFPVLDAAREIISNEIPVTLSIGISQGAESFEEGFKNAALAVDMALSRGGDQAVVKNAFNFEFYGGRSTEIEKRTKVKSRVMANALMRLINDSGDVFVMGHKNADLDAVGAAIGICCLARTAGKRARIVIDREHNAAEALIDRMAEQEEYRETFISPSDAMLLLDRQSLLVIVDVNRPDFVESEEFLLSANRVAVIDHHRRAANYIENAALNFHEPYASSTCELICELVTYMPDRPKLTKAEADALLSGIVLDTKNFTIRTGVRTFEAATLLKMAGADPIEVKRFFQVDFQESLDRYTIIGRSHIYKDHIAIAMSEQTVRREIAAQAADELLNIRHVQASFVLFPEGEKVIISARSLGRFNVQVMLEKMGGGGHLNMAGAQVDGEPAIVLSRLYEIIDAYLQDYGMEKRV